MKSSWFKEQVGSRGSHQWGEAGWHELAKTGNGLTTQRAMKPTFGATFPTVEKNSPCQLLKEKALTSLPGEHLRPLPLGTVENYLPWARDAVQRWAYLQSRRPPKRVSPNLGPIVINKIGI